MDWTDEEDMGYRSMKSIDECMVESITALDQRFRKNLRREWSLVKRNQSITARNRFMKDFCEMFETEYCEMPLEKACEEIA